MCLEYETAGYLQPFHHKQFNSENSFVSNEVFIATFIVDHDGHQVDPFRIGNLVNNLQYFWMDFQFMKIY